jgi:hypothetical protein
MIDKNLFDKLPRDLQDGIQKSLDAIRTYSDKKLENHPIDSDTTINQKNMEVSTLKGMTLCKWLFFWPHKWGPWADCYK